MDNKICLDSDFLIDVLRNKKEAVSWTKENERTHELSTTIINEFELYYGAYKSGLKNNVLAVENIIQSLEILNLTNEITRKAGELAASLEKEGLQLDFRDILIASAALINNLPLKTNNRKHFDRIKGLKII